MWNGQVEKFNRTAEAMLVKMVGKSEVLGLSFPKGSVCIQDIYTRVNWVHTKSQLWSISKTSS